MIASYSYIRDMIYKGQGRNYSHCIVACDQFSFDYYPIYVEQGEDPQVLINRTNQLNMQKVIEVYNYNKDLDEQLRRVRCWEV